MLLGGVGILDSPRTNEDEEEGAPKSPQRSAGIGRRDEVCRGGDGRGAVGGEHGIGLAPTVRNEKRNSRRVQRLR